MAISVRELQYLHREASVGCRRAMVVSRTNGIHTSTTATLREISQRRGELPALHTSTAAPLRTAIYNSTAAPTSTTHRRPSTRYSRTLTDTTTASSTAPRAAPRRVRFELPPKPPPLEPASGAPSGKSAHQQVAGVENWLRSRGSGAVRYQYRGVAVHDTRQYSRGTLPPTASQHESSPSSALLQAARDGDEAALADILGRPDDEDEKQFTEEELNCQDSQGRTPVSYIASHGSVSMMELILQHPGVDINKPDNEGNTPLHFAAQAGHVEVINLMLSRCTNIEVDARNALGFTPLMKAALQGRTKCAKVLLFAGASPTLRDTGRGLRAEQWARFCGRYVCAEVIEKFARHRLLERTTAYGRWGSEPELGAQGGVAASSSTQGGGFRSRLRRAFRTNSSGSDSPRSSRYSLVSQLTTAALCASSPVLPTPNVPPVVRSLMRPLVVPKLQVTPAAATEPSCEVGEYSAKPSSGAKTKKKK